MPKEVIVLVSVNDKEGETFETWGSLTGVCREYSCFQYHTIKKIPFPFIHKGFLFVKTKYNEKNNEKIKVLI